MNLLQFSILGLGLGGAYALLAIGVVTVYRGTGVPNFAQGAMAMISAFVFFKLRDDSGMSTALALPLTILFGVLIGVAFHLLVMRQLRSSPVLAKIVATLALLTLLQGLALLLFEVQSSTPSAVLPAKVVRFLDFNVVTDRLYLAAVAVVLAAMLALVSHSSKTGLAVRAIAENEKGTTLLGYSPDFLGALTWGLGGGLAALAGVLLSPIAGLDANALTLLIVPVFGAALIGKFSSYTWTTIGALVLGMGQSILQQYTQPGRWYAFLWSGSGRVDAFPALIIIVTMVIAGRLLPSRATPRLARMPFSPRPRHLVSASVVGLAIGVPFVLLASRSWVTALTSSLIAAIVALSLVLVTGYVGQISLGQLAFAGVGGVTVAKLTGALDMPFPFPVLIGALVAAAAGAIIGLPSLRVRGPSLAIVTLSAALILQKMVFQDIHFFGGDSYARVPAPALFGMRLDAQRFALFVMGSYIVLTLGVANLRRSMTGHRFLSVRENERAAAAAGISVARTKLLAFSLSAGIAGYAGGLLVYQVRVFAPERFTIIESMFVIVTVYIGGIGMVAGALLAGLAVSGGLFSKVLSAADLEEYRRVIAGGVLLIAIQLHPDGLASIPEVFRRHRRRRTGEKPASNLTTNRDRNDGA